MDEKTADTRTMRGANSTIIGHVGPPQRPPRQFKPPRVIRQRAVSDTRTTALANISTITQASHGHQSRNLENNRRSSRDYESACWKEVQQDSTEKRCGIELNCLRSRDTPPSSDEWARNFTSITNFGASYTTANFWLRIKLLLWVNNMQVEVILF